jgi:AcrR family transcriptional regulator
MPDLVRLVPRRVRERIGPSRKQGRTAAFYGAGLQLLARYDYDRISVANIAHAAGCSVGAFYSRFPDKHDFLYKVVAFEFDRLAEDAARDLQPARWNAIPKEKVVEGIVRSVVGAMARTAGVTRAALKLAMTTPHVVKPFVQYRATVTRHAVALLAPGPSIRGKRAAKVALQLIFGVVTDASLQDGGPLRLGSPRMINVLSELAISYLKLPYRPSPSKEEDKKPPLPGFENSADIDRLPNDRQVQSGALDKVKAANTPAHRAETIAGAGARSTPSLQPTENPKRAGPDGKTTPRRRGRLTFL